MHTRSTFLVLAFVVIGDWLTLPTPVAAEEPAATANASSQNAEVGGADQNTQTATSEVDGAQRDAVEQATDDLVRASPLSRVPASLDDPVLKDKDGRVPPFNFVGQPWQDVLQWLADLSGCSLDWRDLPSDHLNLTTQRSYTIEELRDLVNRHLIARGYTILERDNVLSVFKIDALDPSLVPRASEEDLYELSRYDFVKVSFELPSGTSATEFAMDAKQVLSPNATIVPLVWTNCLLVMDVVANQRGLLELVNGERAAQNDGFREFPLRHVRAEHAIDVLYGLLGIDAQSNTTRHALEEQQRNRLQMMSQLQGNKMDPRQLLKQRGAQDVHLVYNRRRNSILANAPPEQMQIIERAIQSLDVPGDGVVMGGGTAGGESDRYLQRYVVSVTSPESLMTTLDKVGGLEPRTELTADANSGSLYVKASASEHRKIGDLIKRFDSVGRSFEVVRLRRLSAVAVAHTIHGLMLGPLETNEPRDPNQQNDAQQPNSGDKSKDTFRIDADAENNRLLLWANDDELVRVKGLLAKLGEIQGEGNPFPTVRIIEPANGISTERLIKQLQSTWPAISDKELIIVPPRDEAPRDTDATRASEMGAEDVSADLSTEWRGQTASESKVTDGRRQNSLRNSGISSSTAGVLTQLRMNVASNALEPNDDNSGLNAVKDSVVVTITDDGQMLLRSSDERAMDQFEDLVKQLAPLQPRFQVFRLRHASAFAVWMNLTEYFDTELGPAAPVEGEQPLELTASAERPGLSQRQKLQIIYDTPTNTILVSNGTASQLRDIKQLIEEYDQPAPTRSMKARRTAAIKIQNSSAVAIATALKDVYRDLLSSRDKEFESGDKKVLGFASESPTVIRYGGGDTPIENTKQTEPFKVRFDGSLSIGVDESANMLLISAQEELFDSVVDMVHELDKSAPATITHIHRLKGAISPLAIAQAIGAATGSPVQITRPSQSQERPQIEPRPQPARKPKKPSTQEQQAEGRELQKSVKPQEMAKHNERLDGTSQSNETTLPPTTSKPQANDVRRKQRRNAPATK